MANMFAYLSIVIVFWLSLVMQSELRPGCANPGTNFLARQNESITTEDYLDKEIEKIIANAKRINVYHLTSFATDVDKKHKKKKYFAEYEVLRVKKANKKRTSELKSALLEGTNYVTDNTNKCTFTATIGLEIISKSGRVNVVISYRCDKILFLRDSAETYKQVRSLERFDRLASELFKGRLN